MSEDDGLIEVVITAPVEDWLVAFTGRLVEQRLAVCGHHTPIRSVYTWHDQVYDRHETRVALHTRASHFEAIAALAAVEHPYDVPCVVSLPIQSVSASYRAWVMDSTS